MIVDNNELVEYFLVFRVQRKHETYLTLKEKTKKKRKT